MKKKKKRLTCQIEIDELTILNKLKNFIQTSYFFIL